MQDYVYDYANDATTTAQPVTGVNPQERGKNKNKNNNNNNNNYNQPPPTNPPVDPVDPYDPTVPTNDDQVKYSTQKQNWL